MTEQRNPLRVLLVDDDVVDRMAVRRALRAAFDAELVLQEASSAADALDELGRAAWDCVLLDLRLPGTSGLAVLAEMRSAGHRVPVVMLTGHGDEETAVEAMKAGAADYLSKGVLEPERLARSIRYAVRMRDAERETARVRLGLEAAEQRYRFLADSIPQMVWVTGADERTEYVNRPWMDYTGWSLERLRDEGWSEIIHADDHAELTSRWQVALRDGTPFEMQLRLRRVDGAFRWHLTRAAPLRGVQGETQWFGTLTDIEEQKRSEAELVRLKEVAENERRRAERSNQTKDEFLAVLSHELRTPLNAMLGWITILRRSEHSPELLARGLGVIDRNARAQAQLIEDLLDVSRIVAGKLLIEQRAVDLRDVVSAAVEMVQPMAAGKRVAIEPAIAAEPLVVRGDAGRLQQVVWNLLVNAVKFSAEGGRVSVCAQRIASLVELRITDTGRGIDPDFLPHIFQRFSQAEAPHDRSHGGLGLGLSIVHHLVERHGGSVAAASAGSGHGATFTVSLPVDGDAEIPLSPQREAIAPVDPVRGLDVLVVDDDDDSREMLVAALRRQGATVRGCNSVADAREEVARRLPDLLISDLGMPQEDGYALIRELRARPAHAGGALPAIAVTGFAGLDDQRRARAAGFDDHIAKPLDLAKLPHIIIKAIAARQSNGGSVADAS